MVFIVFGLASVHACITLRCRVSFGFWNELGLHLPFIHTVYVYAKALTIVRAAH